MNPLFDNSIGVLSKALDMHLLRHSVIADNIANAETPGFRARRVDFEQELQRAVDANATAGEEGVYRALASTSPVVSEQLNSSKGIDQNTVDMDREMAAMTKNDVKYSSATQMINKKFALLRYAISEGSDR